MTDYLPAVQNLIQQIGAFDGLEPDRDIYEAGLESVRSLDLLLALEDTYGITIPDDRFVECRTAQALATLVAGLAEGPAA